MYIIMSYLWSTVGIFTDVNMTVSMNKDRFIMIIIVEYAIFEQLSRNMQLIIICIFIRTFKNMQKKKNNHRIYLPIMKRRHIL